MTSEISFQLCDFSGAITDITRAVCQGFPKNYLWPLWHLLILQNSAHAEKLSIITNLQGEVSLHHQISSAKLQQVSNVQLKIIYLMYKSKKQIGAFTCWENHMPRPTHCCWRCQSQTESYAQESLIEKGIRGSRSERGHSVGKWYVEQHICTIPCK